MTGADIPGNWVRLVILGIIWGASFLLVDIAVADLLPLSVAAGRLVVASAFLLPTTFLFGTGLPKRRAVWLFALAVAVLSNVLPFTMLSWAQQTVPSGVAAVYMAVVPLIVLFLSHFFVAGEGLTGRKFIGFVIGLAGVLVLMGPKVLSELGGVFSGGSLFALANLACLGASFAYATGSIAMKLKPQSDPLSFGAASMGLAALIAGTLALIYERPFALSVGTPSLLAVVMLGLFPTAIAKILMLQILDRAAPPFLSLVNYQVPVWGVLFGALFLGEAVAPRLGVALMLILFGVAWSQNLFVRLKKAGGNRASHGKAQPKNTP